MDALFGNLRCAPCAISNVDAKHRYEDENRSDAPFHGMQEQAYQGGAGLSTRLVGSSVIDGKRVKAGEA